MDDDRDDSMMPPMDDDSDADTDDEMSEDEELDSMGMHVEGEEDEGDTM